MNSENLELFRTVCFLSSMQRGRGLISKHPAYIREKIKTSKSDLAAWQTLDDEGQSKIWEWANKFSFPLMDCIHEISLEVSP